MMAMSYGYVYVAQVAMGADKKPIDEAVTEAEAYPGPSLIIAYSPCINHGTFTHVCTDIYIRWHNTQFLEMYAPYVRCRRYDTETFLSKTFFGVIRKF